MHYGGIGETDRGRQKGKQRAVMMNLNSTINSLLPWLTNGIYVRDAMCNATAMRDHEATVVKVWPAHEGEIER